ncbi:MAG: pyridoxal phosphate-dependent aminotransferase [Trueperaceae bacterium]
MEAMNVRQAVRDVPAYRFEALPALVKLDQNESPDDLPATLREAALARVAAAEWHRYPDLHPDGLAARLAARHDWPADGVVVAGGSNVLIQALVVLSGIGRHVAALSPSFPLYAQQARLLGAALHEVPLGPEHAFPTEAVIDAVAVGSGVGFLPAPLAPTGNAVDPRDLRRVAEAAGPGWTIVIDEAYAEFAGSDHTLLARDHPRVVVLRTLSKAFGLAGARLGYAVADPALAVELRKVILPFSVSALQLAVGEAVLDAPHWIDERVRATVAERERLAAELRVRGVRFVPSVTNFILLRVADAAATHRGLLRHGVLVRRQDHLPGLAGALRVTVGRRDENDAFLRAWDALTRVNGEPHA